MTEVKLLVSLALSHDRPVAERMASLSGLRPHLHDEVIVGQLIDGFASERSHEVKEALFNTVLSVDIARIANREPYFEMLANVAVLESEVRLRIRAINRLKELALGAESKHAKEIAQIIVETLVSDLDESAQYACLKALQELPRVSEELAGMLDAIQSYGARVSPRLKPELVSLYERLQGADAQRIINLLSPWDAEEVQRRILNKASTLVSLEEDAEMRLGDYLADRPGADFELQALRILLNKGATKPKAVLEKVLWWLEQASAHDDIPSVLGDWIATSPELRLGLAKVLNETRSSELKVKLLELFTEHRNPELYVEMLDDESQWVRLRAIRWCRDHIAEFPDLIAPALMARAAAEKVRYIRLVIAHAFSDSRNRSSEVETQLLQWFKSEVDPAIQQEIASAAIHSPITAENRADTLKMYCAILLEPYFNQNLKDIVIGRLRSFAYNDESGLVECYQTLLESETSFDRIAEIDGQLRTLVPNPERWTETTLKLFYRFAHYYPIEPLASWLRELRVIADHNEAVKSQIPYLIRLTGETWLHKGANIADQKNTFLESFFRSLDKEDNSAQTLLSDAYRTRTIRKSDLITIYKRLLWRPRKSHLLSQVVTILVSEKVVSPELVSATFDYFTAMPPAPHDSTLQEATHYLRSLGSAELGYREKIISLFTQANYSNFCLRDPSPAPGNVRPSQWNEWAWPKFTIIHMNWPVAELYFALNPTAEMRELLLRAPDQDEERLTAITTPIRALILNQWASRGLKEMDDYIALGEFLRRLRVTGDQPSLFESGLSLFAHRWNEFYSRLKSRAISQNLAEMVSEIYSDICQIYRNFKDQESSEPELRLPQPLMGMDPVRLQSVWRLTSDDLNEALERAGLTPAALEKEADLFYQDFARAINEGRRSDAANMAEVLLRRFANTHAVMQRREQIEEIKKKLT